MEEGQAVVHGVNATSFFIAKVEVLGQEPFMAKELETFGWTRFAVRDMKDDSLTALQVVLALKTALMLRMPRQAALLVSGNKSLCSVLSHSYGSLKFCRIFMFLLSRGRT